MKLSEPALAVANIVRGSLSVRDAALEIGKGERVPSPSDPPPFPAAFFEQPPSVLSGIT